MHSLERRKGIRKSLGDLVSLPIFAADLLVLEQRDFDQLFEETLSNGFLQQIDTGATESKNEEFKAMLQALTELLGSTELASRTSFAEHNSANLNSANRYKKKFRSMNDELAEFVASDFSAIFEVEIKGRTHLRSLYREGCVIIRKLCVVTSGSGCFRLFPLFFVGALMCACVISSRIRLYHMEEGGAALLNSWMDNITRVWLQSLKADTVVIEKNDAGSELKKEVDEWVQFILGARNVFRTGMGCICDPFLTDRNYGPGGNTSNLSPLSLDNMAYKDVNDMYAVLVSMIGAGHGVLTNGYSPSSNGRSFELMQVRLTMEELERLITTEGHVTKDEEVKRMRDLMEGFTSMVKRCLNSGSCWVHHDLEDFELCFRSNQFNRRETFSLNSRFLVSTCLALFLHNTDFVKIYRSDVRGIATNALDELLKP